MGIPRIADSYTFDRLLAGVFRDSLAHEHRGWVEELAAWAYPCVVTDDEAKGVLRAEFLKLRALGYDELVGRLAGKQERAEVVGLSGKPYHVELEGFWDDDEHDDLRVVASIDDGGLRAFLPFTDSFTISPTGEIKDHSAA